MTPDPLCPTLIPDGWHYENCRTCADYKAIRKDERNNSIAIIREYFSRVPSLNKIHVEALINYIHNS
jgi:hypothetical protein